MGFFVVVFFGGVVLGLFVFCFLCVCFGVGGVLVYFCEGFCGFSWRGNVFLFVLLFVCLLAYLFLFVFKWIKIQ